MTTIDLTQTDHFSYEHEGQTYIDQATFDLAIEHWEIDLGNGSTDVTSIYDGSEDVMYALAWREDGPGSSINVAIVQFIEGANGYAIDDLPFTLDIAAAVPAVPETPRVETFTVAIGGRENWPYFADDVRVALSRGGLAPLSVTKES